MQHRDIKVNLREGERTIAEGIECRIIFDAGRWFGHFRLSGEVCAVLERKIGTARILLEHANGDAIGTIRVEHVQRRNRSATFEGVWPEKIAEPASSV